jgi:PAS domain S-box-containing protein
VTEPRLRWGLFVAGSLLVVAAVFGTVGILERTIFAGAPLESLKYLYVIRGASASFLVMTLAVFFIVAQHRKSEAEMRKLFRAVEQSPLSILVTDRSGNIEYVNPWFTRLTGYRREEVIGKNPRILQSGQTPRETYKQLWETLNSGREWRGEFLNKKKNGELYWEAASISAITNGKGGITHFVGVLDDITERKKIERLKDEFVGTVSHELRSPVAIIKWSINHLKDGLAGSVTEEKEVIASISRNCERLERMVNDVLDLSRLESGRARVNRRPIDLVPILHETVRNFQKSAEKNRVVLEMHLPPTLPDLHADPDMVVQLVTNLLDNAVRFAKGKVQIEAAVEGNSLQVSVIDDGPGIAEGDLKRLFSKFEQITRPEGPAGYKGTGLGLAICKEIVQQHDGKIWAESVVGQGSKFHFILPIKKGGKEI